MESEIEEIRLKAESSRTIALDVEDGKRSRYWQHLKNKLTGWLNYEENHFLFLNQKLLREPSEIEDRNDTVKRIALLRQVLAINEIIIQENINIIEGMTAGLNIPDQFKNKSTFVGQKPADTNSDGEEQ